MENHSIGEKIKELRKKKKMTQTDLAGEFITRTMLSKIETGVARPSLETIRRIADKLEAPISYFLNESEEKKYHTQDPYLISYHHIAFLYKNGEYKQALSYFYGLHQDSQDPESHDSYYKCLLYICYCLLKKGDYEDLSVKVTGLIKHFTLKKDHYFLSKSHHIEGLKHFYAEAYDKAEDKLYQALDDLARSYVDDKLYHIKLLYSLGFAQYRQNKNQLALQTFDQLIKWSNDYDCTYRLGEVYMLMGNIARLDKKYKESIPFTLKAMNYFMIVNKPYLLASCRDNMALSYIYLKDYKEARASLNESVNYYKSHDLSKDLSYAYSLLFRISLEQGDYQEGQVLLDTINMDDLSKENQVRTLIYASKLALHKKDELLSKQVLFQAQDLLKNERDYQPLKALVYSQLADIYSKAGDYKKAFEYSDLANKMNQSH